MKIGYLSNIYPVTSATFIRREIRTLEKLGVEVTRFAVRRWSDTLVDPADIEEQEQTNYLLSGNLKGLLGALFKTAFSRPKATLSALSLLQQLIKNAQGRSVAHIAYFLQACSLYQQCQAKGIEHIHAHYSTNPSALAMLCQAMGGPTFSFTTHGPDEFDAPYHSSMGLKVEHAAFVVAITDFCKSQLVRYSDFKHWHKIHVFRCGIATDELTPSLHTFEDNYQLIMVARMSGLKGQMLLPEAIAPLTERFPKLKIVLVGDGDIRPMLEEKIQSLGLNEFFDLRGWQSNSDVRRLVGESRALILPSFAEGLPIVFMEAFALGRPAIATYIAGIPELIDEQCGWVVPAGSIERLTQALEQCLSEHPDKLQAMGIEGRKRIEQMHDINLLGEQLKQAFSEQIAANHKH